jgi:hypothetical protein
MEAGIRARAELQAALLAPERARPERAVSRQPAEPALQTEPALLARVAPTSRRAAAG